MTTVESTGERGLEGSAARRTQDVPTRLFLVVAWALLTANATFVVWKYASPFPFHDDWYVLSSFVDSGAMSGENFLGWLFRHHNSHILPLEKLALVACWRLTDGSLRPLLLSSVFVLSICCAFCMLAIRRLRGVSRPEDVVVPLALLGSHSYSDMMWAIMWTNILASGLLAVLTVSIVTAAGRPRPALVAAISAGAAVLSLQGGPGLLYAVGMCPSIFMLAVASLKSARSGREKALVGISAFLVLAVVGALLIAEMSIVVKGEAGIGGRARVMTALFNMLAHGLGSLAKPQLLLCSIVMPLVLAAMIGHALRRENLADAQARMAVMAVLPVLVLCAAVAVSRIGGSGGFVERYVGMVTPIWVSILTASVMMRSAGVLRMAILGGAMLLAAATGVSLSSFERTAIDRLEANQSLRTAIDRDMCVDRIAADLSASYRVFPAELFASQLRAVKALGTGALARLNDSETFSWTRVSPDPESAEGCALEGGAWVLGSRSRLRFAVDSRAVVAVRLTFDCEGLPWSVVVKGGAADGASGRGECENLKETTLFPADYVSATRSHRYSLTIALDAPAGAVVFDPPPGPGRLRIESVEVATMATTIPPPS